MKKLALIITDMQDFFLKNLQPSIQNKLIENQKVVIEFCMKNNIPIIILEYKAGGKLRGATTSSLHKIIKGNLLEIILKENNGGFTKTNLDLILKNLKVSQIILLGLNANGCIQDTAIGALHRGYEVITAQGLIANSYGKSLEISKRNMNWYKSNTCFFDNPQELTGYLDR